MNNKDTVTPIQKQITEVLENQLTEAMSRAYDKGIEHACDIIKQEYKTIKSIGEAEKYHDILNNIVTKLQKLIK